MAPWHTFEVRWLNDLNISPAQERCQLKEAGATGLRELPVMGTHSPSRSQLTPHAMPDTPRQHHEDRLGGKGPGWRARAVLRPDLSFHRAPRPVILTERPDLSFRWSAATRNLKSFATGRSVLQQCCEGATSLASSSATPGMTMALGRPHKGNENEGVPDGPTRRELLALQAFTETVYFHGDC